MPDRLTRIGVTAGVMVCLMLTAVLGRPVSGRRHESRSLESRRTVRGAIHAREAMTRALNRRDLKTAVSFVDPSFRAVEAGRQTLDYHSLVATLTQILSLPQVHQDDRIARAEPIQGGAVRLTIHRVDSFRNAQGAAAVQRFVAIETWRQNQGRWKAVREETFPEK